MSDPELSTMLFTVTFTAADGDDFYEAVDRVAGVIVTVPCVESARCLDDRPLDELRQQMRALIGAHLQIALTDLDRELRDLIDQGFKRGVASMLSQA